jgi:hypothetical protein
MERSVPRRSVGKDLFAEATAETGRSSTRNALDTMIDHLVQRKARLAEGGAVIIDCHRLPSIAIPYITQRGMRFNDRANLVQASLNLLFRQFDADGSGSIDLDELWCLFKLAYPVSLRWRATV